MVLPQDLERYSAVLVYNTLYTQLVVRSISSVRRQFLRKRDDDVVEFRSRSMPVVQGILSCDEICASC